MLVGIDLTLEGLQKKKEMKVKTFLNRMLGLTVRMQDRCFAHFCALFDDEIAKDKSEDNYDDGVVDMRAGVNGVSLKDKIPFYTDATTGARTTLYTLKADRSLDWQHAVAQLDAANALEAANGNTTHANGFYEDTFPSLGRGRNERRQQYLAIRKQYQSGEATHNPHYEMYRLLVPNLGLQWYEQRASLEERQHYRKHNLAAPAGKAKVEREWGAIVRDSEKCCHAQPCHWHGGNCHFGSKHEISAMIAGSILPLWKALAELTIVLDSRENKKMRVTRVRLTSGERLVGIKVPYGRLRNWRAILQRAGVVMDDEALGTINLIEKDAGETATRSAAAEQPVKSDGATGTPGEPAGRPGKRKATEQAGLGRRQMNTDYW